MTEISSNKYIKKCRQIKNLPLFLKSIKNALLGDLILNYNTCNKTIRYIYFIKFLLILFTKFDLGFIQN